MATAAEEVAGLEKVLTRLALTEDSNLQQVLSRLIPAVIRQLNSPHDATRKKVMEILGHVNKRVKALPSLQLPLDSLLATACGDTGSPMVRSFALVYTEMAFERADKQQRLSAVPSLLQGVASRAAQPRNLCLRLALTGLEGLTQPLSRSVALPAAVSALLSGPTGKGGNASAPSAAVTGAAGATSMDVDSGSTPQQAAGMSNGFSIPDNVLKQYPFLSSQADRAMFLDAALKLLLYVPQSTGIPRITNPLQAAQLQAVGAPAAPAAAPLAPPGLSAADIAAMSDKAGSMPQGAALASRKLGVLNFLSGGVASPTELVLPFLVASCDPADAVARRGEELFKRVCTFDGHHPAVDLENSASLLKQLFTLFLGNAGPGATLNSNLPEEQLAQPASAAVRSKILSLLCRSVAAASVFPDTLLAIQEAVYGSSSGAASSSARLRAQGMEFAVWVAKHCPTHQLKAMAPAVLKGLLQTLNMSDEGEDTAMSGALAQDHAAVTLRGFAYQAVGCLASRMPDVLSGRVDLARGFFAALAEEPAGLRATVAEATAALSLAFKAVPQQQAEELDKLLLQSVTSSRDAVRLCAVQWANRVHTLNHVQARWVCVLAAADNKLEVREEAAKGLRLNPQTLLPQSSRSTTPAANAPDVTAVGQLPSLEPFLAYASRQCPMLSAAADANRQLPLSPRSYLALMRFAQACWQAELPSGQPATGRSSSDEAMRPKTVDDVLVPINYLTILEGALTRDSTGELLSAALQALMQAAEQAPAVVESRAATQLHLLLPLLSHVDPSTRVSAARMLGIAASSMQATGLEQLLEEVCQHFGATQQPATPKPMGTHHPAGSGMSQFGTLLGVTGGPVKYETQEGTTMAAGFVLAQCMRSNQAGVSDKVVQSACGALLHAAQHHSTPFLAAAAAQSLGYVGLGAGHQGMQRMLHGAAPASAAAAAGSSVDETKPSSGSCGKVSSTQLLAALGPEVAQLYIKTANLMMDKDAKVAARAICTAGLLAWCWDISSPAGAAEDTTMTDAAADTAGTTSAEAPSGTDGSSAEGVALQWLEQSLMALTTSKVEEIQFTVGESVALLFGGVPLSPVVALRTPFTGLADAFSLLNSDAAAAAAAVPATTAAGTDQLMEVDATKQPVSAATASAARRQVQDSLLRQLLEDMSSHSRQEVRCSAAVWLVSLLTYTGHHPLLLSRLSDCQEALGTLLGDANELTQEMASRGVSLVYQLGSESQRAQLVQALVGVLQGSGPRAAKVKLQADTKVFEEGTLGGAPGGGTLSTYQELCSLATELGQPELVYRFMDLAHHQQALSTRRGAAFGIANVARLAGDALAPHVQQLVPKLYRYQYDPNPRVQDAMASIWKALVADPKAALAAAYPTLMTDLLKEMGGRLWRNRQAACGALADLLQGKRWSELKPYLQQVWVMTFRVMDDIKDSVRKAALLLARAARGVTLRLCDQSMSSPADAREATAVVLPVMLEQGLTSNLNEVCSLALDIIAKAARTAGSEAIKPQLPQLVQALLDGLSSLEDSRLNYLEQHAERLGLDSERLDTARSAAARASPLGDTLDLAARIAGSDAAEGGALASLLPVVTTVLARGVGLNTKMGTARFVRNMATRAASELRPHAPTLIKALLSGLRREKSVAVRKAYAGAAAQVCRYASDKRAEKMVTDAVEMYTNEGADADARLCGGLLLRELLRVAPETFNAHAALILPVAYGAKMDDDKSVAEVWHEVWEEGCSSEAGAFRLYSQEISSLLCGGLASQQWGRKKACAAAIVEVTKLGSDVLPAAAVGRLAAALLSELPGRLWEGKEVVLAALGALASTYPGALNSEVQGGHRGLVDAALSAALRKKKVYRAAGLTCLQACLSSFPEDYCAQVVPVLVPSIQKHLAAPQRGSTPKPEAAAAAGGGGSTEAAAAEEEDQPLPLVESLQCLAAAVSHFLQPAGSLQSAVDSSSPAPESGALLQDMVSAVSGVLQAPLPWQARLAALQAARALCDRGSALQQVSSTSSASEVLPALLSGCVVFIKPVLVCLEDIQLQQVRTTALACLDALLHLVAPTSGAPDVPGMSADVAASVVQVLQAVANTDKAASIVSSAQKLKSWLASVYPSVPVQMDS